MKYSYRLVSVKNNFMVKKFKARILIVEDDTNLGIVLSDFLEMSDFEVVLATNGLSGLEFFKNGNFDICIVDVMLPFMDGFALAEEIRIHDPEIPIIFLTAKTMEKDRIKGLKIGADDYITKPFSTEELNLRINAILRRSKYSILKTELPLIIPIGKYTFDYSNHLLKSETSERRLTKK